MTIDQFVNSREDEVPRLERELYDEIMSIVVGLLFIKGKSVLDARSIRTIGLVDQAFNSFDVTFQDRYMGSILAHLGTLDDFYVQQFTKMGLEASSFEGFGALMTRMEDYLKSVSLLEPVRQEVKRYLLGSIAQGRSLGSIRQGLRSVLGLKERTGVLNRYYRGFLFDSIMEFDRILSNEHAKQNNLNYFQYKGGLIETSREFCIKRDGLVFRRDMADDWKNDPSLPGYPNVADYDPLIDAGRWNCRHYLLWVTDEEAKDLNK